MLIEVDPTVLKKLVGESIQDHKGNSIALAKDIYAKIDALQRKWESQLPTPEDFNYIPEFKEKKEEDF